MKSFKNESNEWQVWANVFTDKQEMVFSGTENECEKFLEDNDPNQSSLYADLFMIAPHTGRYEDFSKFEC